MATRWILNRTPDLVSLFTEFYETCLFDPGGEPLGNVAGHARRRYTNAFRVLELCRILKAVGRLTPAAAFIDVAAQVQDKQASGFAQAAHTLPCDIRVVQTAGMSGLLVDLLQDPFNRGWARRHIFGETDRVHRLTNLADRYCEAAGLIETLIDGCVAIAGEDKAVDFIFWHHLVPGYRGAAARALDTLNADVTEADRIEARAQALRDHTGRGQLMQRPADLRRQSPDAKARTANLVALQGILAVYMEAVPDQTALFAARTQLQAIEHNERKA